MSSSMLILLMMVLFKDVVVYALTAGQCGEAVDEIHRTYGGVVAHNLTKCRNNIRMGHRGYVLFAKHFPNEGLEGKYFACLPAAKEFLNAPVADIPGSSAVGIFEEKIDALGFRKLKIDAAMCKTYEAERKRKLIDLPHDLRLHLSSQSGPWSLVKHFALALYGYSEETAIHEKTPFNIAQVHRSFAVQEVRQRYQHAGFSAFVDVISYPLGRDDLIIPAFILIYTPGLMVNSEQNNKITAQKRLWDAISSVENPHLPHPWILPKPATDEAVRSLGQAFVGTRDLRPFLKVNTFPYRWRSAVTKAALLQTSWLLRGDAQLIDLIKTCVGEESKYWVREIQCELKGRVYITEVLPDWRPPRFFESDGKVLRGAYDAVLRAMSVSIALRHPPLTGVWLINWKFMQYLKKIGFLK